MSLFRDVRMRGFAARTPVATVLALLDARTAALPAETIPTTEAAGRVLAAPVFAAADVPGFDRAAMDGYALRAVDAAGATTDTAVSLILVGESLPARPFAGTVGPQQAVRIATGAPLPAGADAVLVAESAEEAADRVRVRAAIAVGKNIGRAGEDVQRGQEVLAAGRRLRPQDVGMLAAVGVPHVAVVRRPRIALLVTGEELLPPGAVPEGVRIVDSNSPMLAALAARDGGACHPACYLPDVFATVRDAIRDADADVILVTGGTSVGTADHAPRAVAELGELAIHGIALRPGAPAGIGFLAPNHRCVFLLPGNPVACLCAYDLFAGRAVRRLGGRDGEMPYRRIECPLVAEIASAPGRTDYVRVKLTADGAMPLGSGGASILSSTVNADGFVLVDANRERLAVGETVAVHLYV